MIYKVTYIEYTTMDLTKELVWAQPAVQSDSYVVEKNVLNKGTISALFCLDNIKDYVYI